MRTTVTLDPDVERLVRSAMRERGISFKEALNQAARKGLSRERQAVTSGRNPVCNQACGRSCVTFICTAVVGKEPDAHGAGEAACPARGVDARNQLGDGDAFLDSRGLERIPEGSLKRDGGAVAGDGEGPFDWPAHRRIPGEPGCGRVRERDARQ